MANTKITNAVVGLNGATAEYDGAGNAILNYSPLVKMTAGTAFDLDYSAADNKLVILVQNGGSSAATVTISKGDMIQGVSPLEISCASGITAIVLDSGAYKKKDGTVELKASASVSVGVVKMPI